MKADFLLRLAIGTEGSALEVLIAISARALMAAYLSEEAMF